MTIEITAAGDVAVTAGEQTTVQYTVTNKTGRPLYLRAHVLPGGDGDVWPEDNPLERWARIDGDIERSIPADDAAIIKVIVSAPKDARNAKHRLRLDAFHQDEPGRRLAMGQTVNVSIKETAPPSILPKVLAIVAAAIVVLAVVGGLIYWFTRPREVSVPLVLGMALEAAQAEIEEAGLVVVGTATRGQIENPIVLEQNPAAETVVKHGSEVVLVTGEPVAEVPDVLDMRIEDALRLVQEKGFGVGEVIMRKSDPNSPGRVVAQSPSAGDRVTIGAPMTIEYEARNVNVPDAGNRALADAKQMIEGANLVVEIVTQRHDSRQPGSVLSQSPIAGTVVREQDRVVLTVVADRFAAPPLIGQMFTDANLQQFRNDGWTIVQSGTVANLLHPVGAIVSQTPAAGTPVFEKGEIKVEVAGATVMVPSISSGTSSDAAEQLLTSAGLRVKVVSEYSETLPEGLYIRTQPGAGQPVLKGTEVVLYRSTKIKRLRPGFELLEQRPTVLEPIRVTPGRPTGR